MKLDSFFFACIIAISLLLTSAAVSSSAEIRENEWPMFGQNPQRTGFVDVEGPEYGNPIWSFEAGDVITSSPTVSKGHVFVTSHDGYLYALDAESGDKSWTSSIGELGGFSPPLRGIGKSLMSSPAVGEGMVFVGSLDEKVYAFDADNGEKIWSFETGGEEGSGGKVDSSPVVADGTVYVGSRDNNLYALDADTGDKEWSFETEDMITSSPAFWNGNIYFGSRDDNIYSLKAEDGKFNWSYQTDDIVHSSPAVIKSVHNKEEVSGFSQQVSRFYEFFGELGEIYMLQIGFVLGIILLSYLFLGLSNPLSIQGLAILFFTGVCVVLVFLPGTIQEVQESGTVYIGSRDGSLYALNADNGSLVWEYDNISPGKGPVFINTSPAVTDGNVYFGSSNGKIYALDSEKGNLEWQFQTDYRIGYSSPAAVDGMIYEASFDGRYYALDADDGEKVWSFEVLGYARKRGYAISSPAVYENKVFVTSSPFEAGGSKVYALGSSIGVNITDLKVNDNYEVNESVEVSMDIKNTTNRQDNYVIRLKVEPKTYEAMPRIETKRVELSPEEKNTSQITLSFERGGKYTISSPEYPDNEQFKIIGEEKKETPKGYDEVYKTPLVPVYYTDEIEKDTLTQGADNVVKFFTESGIGHLTVEFLEAAYVEMADNVLQISFEITSEQKEMVETYAEAFYSGLAPLSENIYGGDFAVRLIDNEGETFRKFGG